MSMRVLLSLGLAAAAAVGARPLDAEHGTSQPPPPPRSQVHRAAPADAPPSAPIRLAPAAPRVGSPLWHWPMEPRPPVVRAFTAPPTPYGPGHRGLDLRSRDGVDVLAVAAGEVTHAGSVAGRGTVTVAHPGGLSSTYEPVLAAVETGDEVAAGDLLGILGAGAGTSTAGHCGTIACLHLGARHGPAYLDPLPLLVGGRAVLLPLAGLPH